MFDSFDWVSGYSVGSELYIQTGDTDLFYRPVSEKSLFRFLKELFSVSATENKK